jgi:hypothetical protein
MAGVPCGGRLAEPGDPVEPAAAVMFLLGLFLGGIAVTVLYDMVGGLGGLRDFVDVYRDENDA